jgi:hypothetical protein
VPQVTFGKRRILIDTTGGEGGSLSCVLLPENKVLHSDPHLRPVAAAAPVAPPELKKKGWFW